LDIVFLGDGFTLEEIPDYWKTVAQYWRALLSTPPFSGHTRAFNVWRIDVISLEHGVSDPAHHVSNALGVQYDGNRMFYSLDEARVRSVPARYGLKPDLLVVIANDTRYGGAEAYQMVYVSRHADATRILAHEVGHSFCTTAGEQHCLDDEYAERGAEKRPLPSQDAGLVGPNLVAPECTTQSWCSLLPCSATPAAGCFSGGHGYGLDVYHSAEACTMRKLEYSFCPVCSRIIERRLESLATTWLTEIPKATRAAVR
jgi:hypothetical protein